ncbi:MAG TPA: hypothetical protein VD968_00935 [Pyrinomonadaceae bacterium]|nr:hypothetical protein [Pyrinomonadaceae bacterium]
MLRALVLSAAALAASASGARAQWAAQQSGTTVRLRGVSAVSARVAWASGDRGTYARTTDGGKTWRAGRVPGAEDLDFRDVDAFDADTAYLLAIGPGDRSRIYKTVDGGRTWALQFKSGRAEAFFDCMAFWDRRRGVAMSDPVGGRFVVITTSDGGRTWAETPTAGMPPALEGEGGFAASGTCVAVAGRRDAWFGTGGPNGARVFRSGDGGRTWSASMTPLVSDKAAGVFSVFFGDRMRGVVVGGDYTKEAEASGNVAVTTDGGRAWARPTGSGPRGYRSCVAQAGRGALVAVGPSGSDYSLDGGRTWAALGDEGFHAVSFAKGTNAGWAVGEGGRVARFTGRLGKG